MKGLPVKGGITDQRGIGRHADGWQEHGPSIGCSGRLGRAALAYCGRVSARNSVKRFQLLRSASAR